MLTEFILEDSIMKTLLSCEFNMDAGCVELRYSDGSMISIDCTAVEDEVANSYFQRSELDWLIYNKPLEYSGYDFFHTGIFRIKADSRPCV